LDERAVALPSSDVAINSDDRDLKLFFVVDNLGAGGVERSTIELVSYLKRAGLSVRLIALERLDRYEITRDDTSCDVMYLHASHPVARCLELRRIIRAERPDIIHSALFRSDMTARFAAIGSSTTVVSSLVNMSYEPERFHDAGVIRWRRETRRMMELITGRLLTDHFHAVSFAVKRSAMSHLHLPGDRITVIERGRDEEQWTHPTSMHTKRVRARLDLPPEALVLLSVGRQDPQKGQANLLRAFETVASARDDTFLLIAGRPGRSSETLQHILGSMRFAERVRILGHRRDVADLLAVADVFVLPSIYEGLPGSVIEALALGVPCVVSDIPPLREVVEDGKTGILVRPNDVSALAAGIAEILEDDQLRGALQGRCRAAFEERFSLTQTATRMIAFYEEAITEPRATRA
jgi:glycosyltransferase involved in cell wall biosynthesis